MSINEYNTPDELARLEIDRIIASETDSVAAELVGMINNAMQATRAGVLPLPRFEDDTFLSTEQLKELADRTSMNVRVLLAECENLMATAQVIGSLLAGMEGSVQSACSDASEAVRILLGYHASMANSGRSVAVIPQHLDGNYSMIGGAITSGFSGGRNSNARVIGVDTNGELGNFIELLSNTEANKALGIEEILFVDPLDDRSDPMLITDDDEYSMFEVESYDVLMPNAIAVIDENIMPSSLTKIQKAVRSSNQPVTMVDVAWGSGPSSGSLYADVTLETEGGAISGLAIKVADRTDDHGLAIAYPSIDRVDVSLDGKEWTNVKCSVDAIASAAGGEILVHVNSPACRFVRVRLRQSVPYSTIVANACHWMEPASGGEGRWMNGSDEPVFKIGLHTKRDWFLPALFVDVAGNKIKRKIFGLAARRFAIAIKEIRGEVYDYIPETVIQSRAYSFDKPLDVVMLRATERIPDGTDITYEVSHDEGGSWVPITPIERSGSGAEVIVYSAGGSANPNIQSATYVNVQARPKTLMVRAKLSATDALAPSIEKLSIEPTFFEE